LYLILSNDFEICGEEICREQLLWIRCNEKQTQQGEYTLFHAWCYTPMIDKGMMVLQSYTNSENILMGPYGEMYPACHDINQAMNVKAEEVSYVEEEVHPLPIGIQEIKAEPEVSSMCVYAHC
jgi:hypothetical protein